MKAWQAAVFPVPLRPTAHTLWSLLLPTMDTCTRLTSAARAGGASHTESPRRDFGVCLLGARGGQEVQGFISVRRHQGWTILTGSRALGLSV